MKKHLLELVVFICGAVVMVLELVASRVLAPYVGTSTYVWTSIIGIILGSLSLGYWWGGRLADRRPTRKIFSRVIFLAGCAVAVVVCVKFVVLNFIRGFVPDVRIGSVLATLILFAPPSVLLGMVSPYAVRLKIDNVDSSGGTVGNLYAISTVGSIVGTFLAGFYLISVMGSTNILIGLSLVLLFTAGLASFENISKARVEVLILVLVALGLVIAVRLTQEEQGFVDVDTKYGRIWIVDIEEKDTGRPIRMMKSDPFGAQSAMYLDEPDELFVEYTKYYRLGDHFKDNIRRGLVIGGGANSYPRDFLRKHPDGVVDVVEIDEELTKLAADYFAYKPDKRLSMFHEDGRTFLNRSQTKDRYDAIYLDVFKATYSPPFQLATVEAVEKMHEILVDDGVLLMNIESSLKGDASRFLMAEYKTFKKVFPQVYLFPVQAPDKDTEVQNVILAALKTEKEPAFESENEELAGYLAHLWREPIKTDLPIMTDEFAPAEYYMLGVVKGKK